MTIVVLDQGSRVLGIGELPQPVEWLAFNGEGSTLLLSYQFENACLLKLEFRDHCIAVCLPQPEVDNLVWAGALSSESGDMILTLTTGEEE